ncbi:HAMP domain-containing protein [Undibacterium jejuense]|uniref:histidine kinase n=1 Tax=Undibacterium jejuense TaxID=1344949 RepID=A0A923HGX7_9BURK|nr:sensor histidine kinase [Undibacterium jejuense]MBC3861905.1 HAMP domain-containing protein [Undibacterium jejuense]
MRILVRLRLVSIGLFAGLACALVLLAWSVAKYNEVKTYNHMLWNLHAAVSDKAFQRDQYFLFKQSATKKIWSKRQADVINLVNQIQSENLIEDDRDKFRELIDNLNSSEIIFQRIFVLNQSKSTASSSWLDADRQFDIRLISQMLLKDVATTDVIDALQIESEKRVDAAYLQLMLSIAVGIFILVALTISALRVTAVSLKNRLHHLHDGTNFIAAGRLEHRLLVAGNDELSELANSINTMTADLQAFKGSWEAELDRRKNIEIELRRNDALLKSSARIAGVGALELDFTTQEVRWSEQSCTIFGMPAGYQPDYDALLNFFTPTAQTILQSKMSQMLDGGDSFDIELEMMTGQNKVIFVRILGQIEYSPDQHARMIATLQDVTAQRLMDRIKSEFISMVSHELRTPLTSIRGSLGLLASEVLGSLDEKSKKLVVVAHRNSVRLIGLVNDILDINKLASGAMHMDMQKHDLVPLIFQVIENNAAYAREFFIELDFQSEIRAAVVEVDAGRLMQVLTNLISNAVKFSGDPPVVSVKLEQQGAEYKISVSDTGPGISEQFKRKIFGQFAQENNSNTRMNGGSGLGLYISKNLIEKMGGSIGFDSTPGVGTTFWITLRAQTPEVEKQFVKSNEAIGLSN